MPGHRLSRHYGQAATVARVPRTGSLLRMMATLIGTACGAVGMYLSYHLEIPSGTTIVLTNAAVFTVVLVATRGRGLSRTAGMDDHTDANAAAVTVPPPRG